MAWISSPRSVSGPEIHLISLYVLNSRLWMSVLEIDLDHNFPRIIKTGYWMSFPGIDLTHVPEISQQGLSISFIHQVA